MGRAGEHPRRHRRVTPKGSGIATRLAHSGRRAEWTHGVVNPPVVRASTCTFPTLAAFEGARPDQGLYYARRGTPTQWALEEALTELEPGAAGTKLFSSGVGAVAGALIACLKAGDHLLMVDSVYGPTRDQCTRLLAPMGVETSFYDPLAGAAIVKLIRPTTRVLFLESPGSLTFEVQDLAALTAAARAHDLTTIIDNTWATPLRLRAIAAGIDMSVQSLTKYVGGHSDIILGAVTAAPSAWPRLTATHAALGAFASPDDCFLAARGLRTLGLRLDRHEASALEVARFLQAHPLVDRVLHPALPSCPGHAHFARDFTGATGLFTFTLKRPGKGRLAAMLDGLKLFAMGFSWGGFESLAIPIKPERTASRWSAPGPAIRLSIGLEDPADLIADLSAGLARYEAALP